MLKIKKKMGNKIPQDNICVAYCKVVRGISWILKLIRNCIKSRIRIRIATWK